MNTSHPQPDPERVRCFVQEGVPDASPAAVACLVRFFCMYASLPIARQYLLARRIVLREPLEVVARGYREVFHLGLTAAGVAASLKAVLATMKPALDEVSHLP